MSKALDAMIAKAEALLPSLGQMNISLQQIALTAAVAFYNTTVPIYQTAVANATALAIAADTQIDLDVTNNLTAYSDQSIAAIAAANAAKAYLQQVQFWIKQANANVIALASKLGPVVAKGTDYQTVAVFYTPSAHFEPQLRGNF